jgi:DNA-binding transcriptional MerR regulator
MKPMATLGNISGPMAASDTRTSDGGNESTIGEMSAEFGVSLRTLRFYEDRKLLRPRREGHTRLYGPSDRLRMQMIVKGKQLGFTLTEIAELIGTQELSDDFEGKLAPAQIVTQIDHLERQRRDIDEAITRLRATHARLALSARGESRAASIA